jgi:GntR family transcriptional regulator of vanillate catabolism
MKTRSQSVTDQLREMIAQGQIPADTHLQEEACAEMLHVSRTPVRAALGILASEGYLAYRPKRGYVVLEFRSDDVRDAWQLRAWLEGLAAMLAAERGVDRSAELLLRNAIATGDRILSKGRLDAEDYVPYRDMNSTLHSTIIASAGSTRLQIAIRQTMNIPIISDRVVPWDNYEVTKRSHDDHRRIVDAILSREAWRAEALMREHIWFGGKRVSGYPSKLDGL